MRVMTRVSALAIAFTVMVGVGAAAQEQDAPPPRVRLAVAETREVAPVLTAPATVVSRHDSNVTAEAAGRITFVAEEGALVDEGDPVAAMDDADARLQLDEADARLRRLEIALAQQTRDVERREALAARGALPANELDEIVSQRDMAAVELREARIARERAAVELARTSVAAPFTGLVVERHVEVGEYASPGAEMVRLVDIGALEARVQAPVSLARFVREGLELHVSDGADTFAAPIATIIRAGDAVTRTFELRVNLEGVDTLVGAPVRVRVPTGVAREAVCVPRDALLLRPDGAYVMRVDADNVAERVAVTPGAGVGDWIDIGDALAPGDRVVVRGAERLRAGETVNPLEDHDHAGRLDDATLTTTERG